MYVSEIMFCRIRNMYVCQSHDQFTHNAEGPPCTGSAAFPTPRICNLQSVHTSHLYRTRSNQIDLACSVNATTRIEIDPDGPPICIDPIAGVNGSVLWDHQISMFVQARDGNSAWLYSTEHTRWDKDSEQR